MHPSGYKSRHCKEVVTLNSSVGIEARAVVSWPCRRMARQRSGYAAQSERGTKVFTESHNLADGSILMVDLGDVVTLTMGGEQDSTEDKRNPYD
jgi:hypothetical protein